MPKRTPGTDNRALVVCRLLNRAHDVDLLIPKDRDNTARLLDALANLPYRIAAELDPDEVVAKPVTIIGDDPRVDLLTAAASVSFDHAWPCRLERVQDRADLDQLGNA